MAHPDRARVGAVVAVERAQQGALAGARGPDQCQAFAGRHAERHVAQHRQRQVALGVHHEGLVEAGNAENGQHRSRPVKAGSRRRASGYRRAADRRAPGRSGPARPPAPPCMTISRWVSSRATPRSWVTSTADEMKAVDQAAQQVEDARLHRDVEAAGRLVHEHQPGLADEVAGDLQALAACRRSRRSAGRRGGRDRSRPAPASPSRFARMLP